LGIADFTKRAVSGEAARFFILFFKEKNIIF
jgi:hypothetical protein